MISVLVLYAIGGAVNKRHSKPGYRPIKSSCELMRDAVCLGELYQETDEFFEVRLEGVNKFLDCILGLTTLYCSDRLIVHSEQR